MNMKMILVVFVAMAAVLGVVPAVRGQEVTLKKGTVASAVQTISGEVVSINKKKRIITVKDPKGDTMDIKADKEVKNFDQIKKGDKLEVDVLASVAMTLMDPGTKMTRTDTSNVEVAESGEKPKFRKVDVIDLVAEVVSIDKAARTMTLRGPRGKVETLKVGDDVKDFDTLKQGSKIRVQYTQALAVEIKKK